MGLDEEHNDGMLPLRDQIWSNTQHQQTSPLEQQSQVSWDASSHQPIIKGNLRFPSVYLDNKSDHADSINSLRVHGDPESQLLAQFGLKSGRARSFELPASSYPTELQQQYQPSKLNGKRDTRRTQSTSEFSWWSARKRQRVIASNDLIARAKSTIPETTTTSGVTTPAKVVPKRTSLRRFATSPAVLNSQRLLTLVNRISRDSSRINSVSCSREASTNTNSETGDLDTVEDDLPVTDISDYGCQVPSLTVLVPPTPMPVLRPGQPLNPNDLFPEIPVSGSRNNNIILSSEHKSLSKNNQDNKKGSEEANDSLSDIDDYFFNSDSDDEIIKFLEMLENEDEIAKNKAYSSIRSVFVFQYFC